MSCHQLAYNNKSFSVEKITALRQTPLCGNLFTVNMTEKQRIAEKSFQEHCWMFLYILR